MRRRAQPHRLAARAARHALAAAAEYFTDPFAPWWLKTTAIATAALGLAALLWSASR